MKVPIKDLKPNPYRDIDNYPVNEEKVERLAGSIQQTGFWDNIVARLHNGEFQLAYGHHRLEALKRVMKPEDEVDIPVKNLDDATMLKIMANENMEDWTATPAVIDQSVKAARDYLLAHPDEAAKYGQVHKSSATDENILGAGIIAKFLDWNQQKVTNSLQRLKMVTSGKIAQETIDTFKTEGSARAFIEAVKEQEEAGEPIPVEKHKEIARKFSESGNSRKVLDEVIENVTKDFPKSSYDPVKKLEGKLSQLVQAMEHLEECFKGIKYVYDTKIGIPVPWEELNQYPTLIDKISSIETEIQSFKNSHEKVAVVESLTEAEK